MSLAARKKASSLNQKKTGTKSKKTAPPPPPPVDLTVRECLMWNDSTATKSKNQTAAAAAGQAANENQFVYRSVLVRGQDPAEYQTNQHLQTQTREIIDEGTVADAIRGWPAYRRGGGQNSGEGNEDVTEWNGYKFNDEDLIPDIFKDPPAKPAPKSRFFGKKPSGEGGKEKRHTMKSMEREEMSGDDVYIGDLISQKFHHEYMAKREAEMAKEARKKELKSQALAEGRRAARDRTDIKANRTSQLRSIALAEKVQPNPMDLWKMEKFKKVPSHLATMRNGRAIGLGCGRKGCQHDADDSDHALCTCYYSQPNYEDDELAELGNIQDGGAQAGQYDEAYGYSSMLAAL